MNHRRVLSAGVFLCLTVLHLAGCAGATAEPTQTATPSPPTTTSVPPTATRVSLEEVMQFVHKISWLRSSNAYGHTAIMIQGDDRVIYLDPVDLVSEELPQADVILITHGHGDHFSPDDIEALSKESTVVISTEDVAGSLKGANTVALAPGVKVNVEGLEIESIPAYNDSHVKVMGYLGFLFSIDDVRIYLSGDTGLTPEMEALSGIDIAVLNVRNVYSLSGQDVVRFAELVKPEVIIPIHWMPENDVYLDQNQIDFIRENMPATIRFVVLELEPSSQ